MNQQNHLLSDKKLAQIAEGKIWDFHGGIHPEQNKQQSNQSPISDAGIPAELVIAVEQKGQIPTLLVKVGDSVLKGQPLTKVYGTLVVQHASSSGYVSAIEPRTDCHPSGLTAMSVVIKTDGLDRPFSCQGFKDYQQELPTTLIDMLQQSGVIGLGGAGFATHLKLSHEASRLLIINAIECEPYITADDRLTQEHADEIIIGTQIVQHILKPALTVFAIEDNKPEAIEAFNKSLQALPDQQRKNFLLKVIPTRYPSGSAKQLIEVLTGEQTPMGKHSSELGISMLNVGTVFAIKEAIINGKPLVSRIVTITGDAFTKKGNARVRIGTPIQYLLDEYSIEPSQQQKLIIGGPMMGFTVNTPDMSVSKICNCILAPTIKEAPPAEPEMSCIRCSECAEACPADLLPQQLLWYSQSKDHKKLEEYDLSACIECGACAFVCPSHIPLVEYYRIAKAEIKTAKEESDKAAQARQRHENRELRLEKEKQERQLKHKQAADKRRQQMKENNSGEDLVAAALARAKAKKLAANSVQTEISKQNENSSTETATPKNAAVAAAIARAKAKKLAAASEQVDSQADNDEQANVVTENEGTTDPRKAVIAAAVARAKAKKLAAASEQTDSQVDSQVNNDEQANATTENEETTDPRKAVIAAAVARAKAKKLAAASKQTDNQVDSQVNNDEQANTTTKNEETTDPRKAVIAAAVARAKAKKLAAASKQTDNQVDSQVNNDEQANATTENEETTDPRKAVIAAAVARAKAKKLATTSDQVNNDEQANVITENEETTDPRKALIAAAVARAKAKKLAAASEQEKYAKQMESMPTLTEPDNSEVIKQRAQRKEAARLHKQQCSVQQNEPSQIPTENDTTTEIKHTNNNDDDNKKAKIAAVIAKAKAQKLAEKDQ